MIRSEFKIVFCLALAFALYGNSRATAGDSPNILLICVDDLRPELRCFGAEHIHSPHIDGLAARGCRFLSHYVQAPTCGASRFALLTGRYGGATNNALFDRAKQIKNGETVAPSMPAWFREHGYRTVSVGKVSHHPGGLGGPDWNDTDIVEIPDAWDEQLLIAGEWQHPRGFMHGLANGEIRVDPARMDVLQSAVGDDDIYPDGLTTEEAIRQLDLLANDQDNPFFLAVGLLKPHLPFGAPAKYLELYNNVDLPEIPHPAKPSGRTTWHSSGEFMRYNRWGQDPNLNSDFANQVRKHYAACVSYADEQVGKVLAALESSPAAENTIIVLWGDHGWHLGEHAIWGKHSLFEESLRSPLIVVHSKFAEGSSSQVIVETIDVFPTLCELAAIDAPNSLVGHSLVKHSANQDETTSCAVSYTAQASTIRTAEFRLISHRDGYQELYDLRTDPGETQNVAAMQPDVAGSLKKLLETRLATGHPRD